MRAAIFLTASCCVFALGSVALLGAGERPVISSILREADKVVVKVNLPSGFRHAVLQEQGSVGPETPEALVAAGLDGGETIVTFSVPMESSLRFLTLRAGTEAAVPPARYTGPAYLAVTRLSDLPLTLAEKTGHVLNRVAYGPSAADLTWVQSLGIAPYLEAQLRPATIDESSNTELLTREAAMFDAFQPHVDTSLVTAGDTWRYFKGTQAPPADWASTAFVDTAWLEGPTSIGYGDDDDATVLDDMQQTATQTGYLTVFLRRAFEVADPASVGQLILRVDYDDGFVAYLNGTEIVRTNVTGQPPAFDVGASGSREAGTPQDFDLTAQKSLLHAGVNVLAVQVHNFDITSSDLSINPSLVSRTLLPEPPISRIRGVQPLQNLIHVRGTYARRQLQAVLGEFWENHFTTDSDKVADYFDALRNSDATDAMPTAQASAEAAQVEYEEYQFFHDHALGNFGDLLLRSATSPAMLIYLDNVLNRKGEANENYAREILELFAFGVDNRYTQQDIEQLARCFTGWTVRKVWPSQRLEFPASARTPLTEPSVQYTERVVLDLGSGWSYFKGQSEPSPDTNGQPTVAWTEAGFDTSAWLSGATGIGYGDNDDATVLSDMAGQYATVYLRRNFTLNTAEDLKGLLLAVDYDDGFVAYVNGVEVARSGSMSGTGTPPRFNTFSSGSHEATGTEETFSLEAFRSRLRLAPEVNVLAIQVHNVELASTDLSIRPRLIQRQVLPGSIENGDSNGSWVFRFNPGQHDTNAKSLFPGTPYAMTIPAGRTGVEGVRDAQEVIDAMVAHPSTREFICMKLINRLVSDDINLISYRNGTAPEGLRQMMDEALAAWMSTTPPGNIETVLRAVLRPQTQDNYFWQQSAYRVKVKTPVEFINSSLRALNAASAGNTLPQANSTLGMELFTRDDPDGWSELGFDWVDTAGLLERVKFLQRLAGNLDTSVTWNLDGFLASLPQPTAENIVDRFNELLYEGRLTAAERSLLIRYASTGDAGEPLPFDPVRSDFRRRAQDLVALILALPQFQTQ